MKAAIDETNRRREIQSKYNKDHNITPKSIKKDIRDVIQTVAQESASKPETESKPVSKEDKITALTSLMQAAAKNLEFEKAAKYRDEIEKLKKKAF